MSPDGSGCQGLDHLLDELDEDAWNQLKQLGQGEAWACRRARSRYPFRADCRVRFLPADSPEITTLAGRTRNLSRSGFSLLVRRLFSNEDPVEVEVVLPDRPRLFLGGLVRFCRYAGCGFYEVGIELRATSSQPIFSNYPMAATRILEALNAGQALPAKAPADVAPPLAS